MKTNILEVNDLSKHFIVQKNMLSKKSVIHAVKNVSFVIEEGKSFGLIGESGCGKTTIANLILKLIEQSEGSICLFGEDISSLSEKQMLFYRKDLQVIFQYSTNVLDFKMTIEELIKEPLRIHKIVKKENMDKEVDRLLLLVGISSTEKHKFPTQLSGGQNQRIIIARAIATRPKLIICDEPVSALDISVQGQILNLLVRLKKDLNLAYLFISHDLKVIHHMCDNIAVMKQGEIVEMNDADEIMNNPTHDYTKKLVEAIL